MLTPSVLADVGLDGIAADGWVCIYNHMRRSGQRVKPNHVSPVDVNADVYIKAVSVKRCPQFEDYLSLGSRSGGPHFYNLHSERASVEAKVRQTLELPHSFLHSAINKEYVLLDLRLSLLVHFPFLPPSCPSVLVVVVPK